MSAEGLARSWTYCRTNACKQGGFPHTFTGFLLPKWTVSRQTALSALSCLQLVHLAECFCILPAVQAHLPCDLQQSFEAS